MADVPITTRAGKGSELTYSELDANLTRLAAQQTNVNVTSPAPNIASVAAHRWQILNATLPSSTEAVIFGGVRKVVVNGPGTLTGNGHGVGGFDFAYNYTGVAANYGNESRMHYFGSCTFGANYIAQVHPATATGGESGATGPVTDHVDFFSPPLNDHAFITRKWSLYNIDPQKSSFHAGPFFGAGGEYSSNGPGLRPNAYYMPDGVTGPLETGIAAAVDQAYGSLVFVPVTTTYTRVGLEITAAAAGSVSDLLVCSDAAGAPGAVLASVEVSTAAVGVVEGTINTRIPAGPVWLVLRPRVAQPTIRWGLTGATRSGWLDHTLKATYALGPMAGSLPSSLAGLTVPQGGFGICPLLWLRSV